jgi:muramoyltetrapeptide carboxypeptidase
MSTLLYPPRLAVGDTLGLVAPASPPDQPEKIEEAIARLIDQGFRIKHGKHANERDGYLAGTDEERAEDLNAMFADPDVQGIFAVRGGYGSCRILPLVDYAAIRANPKPFIGYSDITALHHAILVKAGLVTFHGPNAREAFLPGNAAAFHRLFLEPVISGAFSLFERSDDLPVKTVVPGRVRGRLLGGNMTCLLRLLGTPYAPDFRGAILFLEDIGEKAYRIDGLFTHLRLAGALAHLGGLILGRFDYTGPEERARIEACLQCEAEHIGVPCVSGAPIGHFPEQIIVPIGVEAELNADLGILTIDPFSS